MQLSGANIREAENIKVNAFNTQTLHKNCMGLCFSSLDALLKVNETKGVQSSQVSSLLPFNMTMSSNMPVAYWSNICMSALDALVLFIAQSKECSETAWSVWIHKTCGKKIHTDQTSLLAVQLAALSLLCITLPVLHLEGVVVPLVWIIFTSCNEGRKHFRPHVGFTWWHGITCFSTGSSGGETSNQACVVTCWMWPAVKWQGLIGRWSGAVALGGHLWPQLQLEAMFSPLLLTNSCWGNLCCEVKYSCCLRRLFAKWSAELILHVTIFMQSQASDWKWHLKEWNYLTGLHLLELACFQPDGWTCALAQNTTPLWWPWYDISGLLHCWGFELILSSPALNHSSMWVLDGSDEENQWKQPHF